MTTQIELLPIGQALNRIHNGDFTQGFGYWVVPSGSTIVDGSPVGPNHPKRMLSTPGGAVLAQQVMDGVVAQRPSTTEFQITAVVYNEIIGTIEVVTATREVTGNVSGSGTLPLGTVVRLTNMPSPADNGEWRVVAILATDELELRPADGHTISTVGPPGVTATISRRIDHFRYQVGIAATYTAATYLSAAAEVRLFNRHLPASFTTLLPQSKPFQIAPTDVNHLDPDTAEPPVGGEDFVRVFFAFDIELAAHFDSADIRIGSGGAGVVFGDVFVSQGEVVSISQPDPGPFSTSDLVEYSVDPLQIMAPGGELVMMIGDSCPPGYEEVLPPQLLQTKDGTGTFEVDLSTVSIEPDVTTPAKTFKVSLPVVGGGITVTEPASPPVLSRTLFSFPSFFLTQAEAQQIFFAGMHIEIEAILGLIHILITDVRYVGDTAMFVTHINQAQRTALLSHQAGSPTSKVRFTLADFHHNDRVRDADINIVDLAGIAPPVAVLDSPPVDPTIRIYDPSGNVFDFTIKAGGDVDTTAATSTEDLATKIAAVIDTEIVAGTSLVGLSVEALSQVVLISAIDDETTGSVVIVTNIATPHLQITAQGHGIRPTIVSDEPAVRDLNVTTVEAKDAQLIMPSVFLQVGDVVDFIDVRDTTQEPPTPVTITPRRVKVELIKTADDNLDEAAFVQFFNLDDSALPTDWAENIGGADRTNIWRVFPAQQFGHRHVAQFLKEGRQTGNLNNGQGSSYSQNHLHEIPRSTDLPSYLRTRLCERL